jgi:hypothetical protein
MSFEMSDNPTHLFSAGHIRGLTVQDALVLEIPHVSSDEFEVLEYCDAVNDEDMLRVADFCFYMPSLREVRSVLTNAPIQYGRYGKRSVRVNFRGE